MAYITNVDIEQWVGTTTLVELTDDTGAGSVDVTRVDASRLGAEGEADSYLATRYAVPIDVSSEPDLEAVLKIFILDLAAYRLHGRRPPVPADVVRRREEAVAWFLRAASGDVQLPTALAAIDNPALGTIGRAKGPKRSMTRESLEDI